MGDLVELLGESRVHGYGVMDGRPPQELAGDQTQGLAGDRTQGLVELLCERVESMATA